MADVGDHFTNLWFAGRAENWPLADFYLGETKSHLRWAVRRIPIRKDNQGREINLTNILEAFENSQLTQLKQAVDRKDGPRFERLYRESLTMCYSCHKAADKPYLRPQVPTEPATRSSTSTPRPTGRSERGSPPASRVRSDSMNLNWLLVFIPIGSAWTGSGPARFWCF